MRNFAIWYILFSFVLMAGCAEPVPDDKADKKEIYIVYTDWAECVALTCLSQYLLEDYLGYDVITRMTDIETVFADIASGRADVFTDVWVPHTHASFLEQYAGMFEDLGPNYLEARTGLVVPGYMPVESIPGLRELYTDPITGIDTSAGIMRNTMEAILAYELENELLVLSDPEMTQKLRDAILRRESIVVTGWEPHWIFHRYDLRFLDDPFGIYMEKEAIHSISRNGFSEDFPRAARLFERMVLSERQMNSLLYEVERRHDSREGVIEWVKNNEFIVNRWVRGLMPEREKIM